jgi:hypothetical protein
VKPWAALSGVEVRLRSKWELSGEVEFTYHLVGWHSQKRRLSADRRRHNPETKINKSEKFGKSRAAIMSPVAGWQAPPRTGDADVSCPR